jgi:hypothetical protein
MALGLPRLSHFFFSFLNGSYCHPEHSRSHEANGLNGKRRHFPMLNIPSGRTRHGKKLRYSAQVSVPQYSDHNAETYHSDDLERVLRKLKYKARPPSSYSPHQQQPLHLHLKAQFSPSNSKSQFQLLYQPSKCNSTTSPSSPPP